MPVTYKRKTPDPTLEEFGTVMRKYRKRKSMDVHEVADKIGVSTASILNWEAGITAPNLLRAISWCEVLGVDLWPTLPGEA
jgi:DNA-binding XRE family transcriptional regulator